MSKKNFKGGLNSLLGDTTEPKKTEVTFEGAKIFLDELQKATDTPEDKGLTMEKAKAFLDELNRLTDEPERPKRGRPKVVLKTITKSSQEGTKENETRATFILNEDLLEKLKAIAYWERQLIKEVVNEALLGVVTNYEKKHGQIKPIPKK
jgi:hypothetical protein